MEETSLLPKDEGEAPDAEQPGCATSQAINDTFGAHCCDVDPSVACEARDHRRHFHGLNMAAFHDDDMKFVAASMILAYFVVGVIYYSYWSVPDHFAIIDSVYFCVTTLTTVGYGDTNEKYHEDYSIQDMLFTSFFVLVGVGLIGTALGVAMAIVLDEEDAAAAALKAKMIEEAGDPLANEPPPPAPKSFLGVEFSDAEAKVLFQVPVICFLLAIGTVSFKYLEDVGLTTAFYWTAVSITTVGYGDVYPTTKAGKVFAIFFLLIGCCLMAKAIGEVANLPLERRRRRNEQAVLDQYGADLDAEEFEEILESFKGIGLASTEGDGSIAKTEFVLSMLYKLDIVKPEDIKRCVAVFDELDADKSGRLDKGDFAKAEPPAKADS